MLIIIGFCVLRWCLVNFHIVYSNCRMSDEIKVSITINGEKKRTCENEKEDQPDVKKNKPMAKQRQPNYY